MSDVLDRMQERMALLFEMQEQALLASATRAHGESARHCSCGNAIPEARRRTLPGVQTCAACQQVIESKIKQFRR